MLLCLSSITLLTTFQMSQIIQQKFQKLVTGFFFSVMTDLTSAISLDLQDSFQVIQRELVAGKMLIEGTQSNEEYILEAIEKNADPALESHVYYQADVPTLNRGNFDEYVFPFPNGSTPFYTYTPSQERDLNTCRNTFYYHQPTGNFHQLVISIDDYYLGSESGMFCQVPSGNASFFFEYTEKQEGSFCFCDAQSHCYYSPVCRPWYLSQKQSPSRCIFEDLYHYAGQSTVGLTICAPVNQGEMYLGALCADVIPSYDETRAASNDNYIKNMYLAQSERTNFIIADNQDIWDERWDPNSFRDYLKQVIDFNGQYRISDFSVYYEFPASSTKLAFFHFDNSKYAMIMQNFSVHIQKFTPDTNEAYKQYTFGLMFESSIIEEKIQLMQHKFYKTFLVRFVPFFLGIIIFFQICEVIFIILFTKRIFLTINDLFEKIDMLSKQHRNALKRKINVTKSARSYESLKTQEIEDQFTDRRLSTRQSSNTAQSEEQLKKVDVLQDYRGNESCMEVTKLYRAANKLIKTITLAKTSIIQGNDNAALLSYNEVAHLFQERHQEDVRDNSTIKKVRRPTSYITKEEKSLELVDQLFDNSIKKVQPRNEMSRNLAICYNNIACIHAKKKNFTKQNLYFSESIRIEEYVIACKEEERKFTSIEDNFKLACKYFNYGYSLSRQVLFNRKKRGNG
ncbi:hypothetical protein FGO68_gene10425 [Halteria grandinella]|uniref:Uncharacterized protein n=1 Tax=Halteria grandinella TaxID=5974 RepID=A0A8J8P463_HALGN|nr:hypothetical protein FGO68_gene10425 [Halteria grandinella]